jgi:hypothetical protein
MSKCISGVKLLSQDGEAPHHDYFGLQSIFYLQQVARLCLQQLFFLSAGVCAVAPQ